MVVRSTAARVAETAPADFRLRSFVERLVSLGEVDIVDDNVDLVDVAARLDGNPKAVLFRSVDLRNRSWSGMSSAAGRA